MNSLKWAKMINKIIDTCVIIRYITKDHPEHYKIARDFFDLLKFGKERAYLEQTVLTETVFVLSSKIYQAPRREIADALYDLLIYKGIYNHEKEVLLESLKIYAKTNLSIVDCIIATKAKYTNLKIQSFDQELLKYSNVNIDKDS